MVIVTKQEAEGAAEGRTSLVEYGKSLTALAIREQEQLPFHGGKNDQSVLYNLRNWQCHHQLAATLGLVPNATSRPLHQCKRRNNSQN
jgi:hypothetical protein